MIITSKINMDLAMRGISPVVSAVQDDKYSRNLKISLYENCAAWNPPAGTAAIVRYKKSDGTGGNYDTLPDGTAGYSIVDNVITVALAPQVCAAPGVVLLAVCLINAGAEINTFSVKIDVQPNPGLQITSEDYYRVTGSVADSGWTPNMYLGTDAMGNVVTKAAPEGGGGQSGAESTVTAISVTESADGTVTMVNTLEDGGTETLVISPDASGKPNKLTYNGTEVPITWTEATA